MLSHLKQIARNSYNWISQDPDGRGQRCLSGWNEEIQKDVEKIKSLGANEEQVERYKKGYEKHLVAWYSSQGNCASSFVCGPANFPVAKMQKRYAWADNHYKTFRAWREKVLNAYDRYERKRKIDEAGGPLEIAKNKLSQLEAYQEKMKRVNKAHKAYLKNQNSIQSNTELSDDEKDLVIKYVSRYSWEPHPFAPYQLTNNNAMIKNTKDRIKDLENKEQALSEGNKQFEFEGGTVVFNVELDRICIKHDEKPASDVIQTLKKNGFRWSPFHKVWMRQITENAKFITFNCLNLKFKNVTS